MSQSAPPRFLPAGRVPTLADLDRLAAVSPAVHMCLQMHRAGDLTMEEALLAMVLAAADQNADLQRALMEASLKERVVYLKPPTLATS